MCCVCHTPLDDRNFYEKNGKAYCEHDYNRLFAVKCCKCGLPITDGNRVVAMGKSWSVNHNTTDANFLKFLKNCRHPRCFSCIDCAKQLTPNNFFEMDGEWNRSRP